MARGLKLQRLSIIVRIGMGFFALWGVAGVGFLIAGFTDATDLVFVVPAFLFTAALLYGAVSGRFPDIPTRVESNGPSRK
jgi:hypothetical protein